MLAAPLVVSPSDMKEFLEAFSDPRPECPIPVGGGIFPTAVLEALHGVIMENSVARRDHRELSNLFEQAYMYNSTFHGTEYNMVYAWDHFVRRPLQVLSVICNRDLAIDRNASDHSGVVVQGKRPDFLCRLNHVLVVVGEEKAGSLSAAIDDLEAKIQIAAVGNSGMRFIFAYATGGRFLQYILVLPFSLSFNS